MNAPKIGSKLIPFSGMEAGELRTFGSFTISIQSNGLSFELRIHVVPDNVINHDLLLSGDPFRSCRNTVEKMPGYFGRERCIWTQYT